MSGSNGIRANATIEHNTPCNMLPGLIHQYSTHGQCSTPDSRTSGYNAATAASRLTIMTNCIRSGNPSYLLRTTATVAFAQVSHEEHLNSSNDLWTHGGRDHLQLLVLDHRSVGPTLHTGCSSSIIGGQLISSKNQICAGDCNPNNVFNKQIPRCLNA